MKPFNINPNLFRQLSALLPTDQLLSLLNKYDKQKLVEPPCQSQDQPASYQNETFNKTKKPAKPTSRSKQRTLLKSNPSNQTLKQAAKKCKPQLHIKKPQQAQQGSKKILKDKAVFVNVSELPYLHSSDLLNHLYKKGSNFNNQIQTSVPLYNPPLNNTHTLTKVKHLHIYYCKIESLRDMGTGWSNLLQLSIYYGKLKDLSGINAFPSLQYLHCPFNCIETVSDVMFHPTLFSIDLEFNQILDYAQVEHLFTVQNLEYINLLNNPVYSNKESRRKINQKFQKIIETENTRVEDYVNEQKREAWQVQNMENVEYCNNLVHQFYQSTLDDDLNVEKKYKILYSNSDPNNNHNSQGFSFDFKQTQSQGKPQPEKQLRIEYIAPQIPENAYFQQMIINGQSIQTNDAAFCQQKIFMTPLIQMIDTNSFYTGPVLTKYLTNKLYTKDQKPKSKNTNQSRPYNQLSSIKILSKLPSESLKKNQSNLAVEEPCITQNIEAKVIQFQRPSEFPKQPIETPFEFGKTSTSLSTNCTNFNNTSTSFSFKRTRPSLSKSKEKSLTKKSLLTKLNQNIAQTQFIKTNYANGSEQNKTALIKQSRLLLSRNLTKQSIDQDLSVRKDHSRGRETSIEKQSFSTRLKRKNKLSEVKKQRSMMLKKQLQV